MDRFLQLVCILCFGVVVGGCASGGKTSIDTVEGLRVLAIPDDLTVAYIKANDGPERLCSPRFGDASEASSNGFGLTLPVLGAAPGAEMERSVQAVALGGRDPAVLMLREMLFRVCELSMNLNLSKEETLNAYDKTLATALEMVRLNAQNAGTPGSSSNAATTENSSVVGGATTNYMDSILKP